MRNTFKTAYRNLIGAGLRTWLNIVVLSFSFVLILFMQGMLQGWNRQALKDTTEWEIANGQYWQEKYDKYDPFTLTDSHAKVPQALAKEVEKGKIVPILMAQGTMYPQGRMQNILLKGIDPKQTLLKLPSAKLDTACVEIPVIMGYPTAKAANLKKGDVFTLRWRDAYGTFQALDVVVAGIFQANVPGVDNGQIWLPLNRFREMMNMPNEATLLVISPDCKTPQIKGWDFHSTEELNKEMAAIIKQKTAGMSIFYVFLLLLALIAIFDTQVLAIFRRQKEIGTFIALGMTQKQVIRMFTLEGTMYSFLAILLGCVYGIPLLIWEAVSGIPMPGDYSQLGIAISDRIYGYYSPELIIGTAALIIGLTTFVSWFPARKIAKMSPTDAIRGKVNSASIKVGKSVLSEKLELFFSKIPFIKKGNGNELFALRGILRDKQRSVLPILVVTLGVMLVVFLQAYVGGALTDNLEFNAKFNTGHVRIMSEAYAENASQLPNDLALTKTKSLQAELEKDYPDMDWVPRIRFGGLLDVPDAEGNTRAQVSTMGIAADFFNKNSQEAQRLNLTQAIQQGHLPEKKGEVLISKKLQERLKLKLGDKVTFIGSSMFGEMVMYNFTVCGTVVFGSPAMDRGAIIADISDVRMALNMEDATGELLGFFHNRNYDDNQALEVCNKFNSTHKSKDEFRPVMQALSQDSMMGFFVVYSKSFNSIIIFVFVLAMSIILWNAGLLGSLRRYNEFGVRLAIGEKKKHLFISLIRESVIVGIIGSVIGTAIGLLFAWYMETYGVNISGFMKGSTVMMQNVLRAHITPLTWYIGFIPGLLSTVLGAMLAGRAIYKRRTAQLFKELE